MNKLIKDGKVAVLYSPGFGAKHQLDRYLSNQIQRKLLTVVV